MSKEVLKIGLDAGHAGFNKTAGKRTPDGEFEWDFNNIVVSAMEKEFAKYEGIETLRVDDRTGKRDVPLRERTDLVNDWKAHLFISYHHNALTGIWGDWTGTETYTYNGKDAESEKLAKIVNDAIVEEYKLRNRGLKKANFHILRESKMPVILAEGAYMDSRIDIKVMRNKTVLEQTGINIAKKVAEGYGKKLKPVAKPVAKPDVVKPKNETKYRVQVGAFKDIAGVAKYSQAVEAKTGYATYITEIDGWLKVQVGAFLSEKNANERLASVKKAGYKDAFITTKAGVAVSFAEPQNEPTLTVKPKPVVTKPAPAPKPVVKPKAKKFNLPTKNYWNKTPQFNGEDVRIIQQALASIYFYPERGAKNNGVDGWYGVKTANAVRRFQMMYGLKVDGIYGANTRAKLDSIVNK